MKKIISIVLAVAIVATGVLVWLNGRSLSKHSAQISNMSDQLTDLHYKKNNIEKELEQAWNEYDEILSGGDCCFTFFVDNITPNLMDKVYPLLNKYGYKATVVMDKLQVPSDEGCIPLDDYNKLLNAGWDFAIGTKPLDLEVENSEEVLEEYIKKYEEKLTLTGVEMPKTLAFGKGQYSERYTDIILNHGFNVVRHYEELDGKFSRGVERNGLYLLSTANICTSSTTLKRDMSTAYDELYTYSATVRYVTEEGREDDKRIDCSTTKYTYMLDFIKNSCGEAQIFTATELYEYKTNVLRESDESAVGIYETIDTLENQLAEVETQIDELLINLGKIEK